MASKVGLIASWIFGCQLLGFSLGNLFALSGVSKFASSTRQLLVPLGDTDFGDPEACAFLELLMSSSGTLAKIAETSLDTSEI